MDVQGRVAVITGGGSGIGRAIALRLAERGARVAVADIDLGAAQRVAAEVGGAGFVVDVSELASVTALAEAVRERYGPAGVLVNNAGVASTGRLETMNDADWAWLLGVNLLGTIHGVAAFLPQLRVAGGAILNTGSMAGLAPDAGMGGYGTTKFAVTAYTEVLADELADEGIAVTLLAPGPVRTGLGASSRNRPAGSAGGLVDVDLAAGDGGGLPWLEADEVAVIAADAIADGRRYAITHPDWSDVVIRRHRAIERAFAEAAIPESSSGRVSSG
ncbi:SDR family oxidoreductase [Herbiconiux sp. YIM B11900]|uniref:SDR family oxidoreductase n=1 Tax=Herbiconiux sp. YIM B11900 TaxID=3404131 RepID=UPI003F843E97